MNVLRPFVLVVCSAGIPMAVAATDADAEIETITVYGHASPLQGPELTAERSQHGAADAARLFELLPGANTNENGAISGQIQYRGLFGPRTDVRVNGLGFPSGGPNWMDPPMHYVPPGLIEEISLHRGISGVDNKNIGGHARAQWKKPAFTTTAEWSPYLDVDSNYRSVDEGYGLAATAGLANQHHRAYIMGSDESADDYESAEQTIDGTEFQRQAFGIGYGWQQDESQFDIGYYRVESDDAGTPTLPLDIEFFETDLWQASFSTPVGPGTLSFSVGGSSIEHGMNNTELRPTPDFSSLPLPPFAGPDARRVAVSADSLEVRASYALPVAEGIWTTGIDFNEDEHEARVTDPDFAPFFVQNFNDSEHTSTALYSSWAGRLNDSTKLEFGVRITASETETGEVDAFPAQLVDANPAAWPMGTPPRAVFVLRERFNAADRKPDDTLVDWMVQLNHQINNRLSVEAGVARKTRLPIYLERYLWIPLEVNAGLGDGNNYVGNPELDPEVAHQIELALGWQSDRAYLSPRLFYHDVKDYIQGVAVTDPVTIAVSGNANGDATPLVFSNVDAELYGFDMGFGVSLGDNWRVDGNVAYVRGRRTDISDNLYRIAPPSLRVGLTWMQPSWRITLEHLAYARQDKLSRTVTLDPASSTNTFAEIPGHGLFNLYAHIKGTEQLSFSVGVENLTDKDYTDPLSGFNRNADAGPVGQRLPGRGRNAFVRVNYRL
ncbi:MAG: TonB-dependent receptor [Pseudomonadota bacterium]